jgi:hypothetical protein
MRAKRLGCVLLAVTAGCSGTGSVDFDRLSAAEVQGVYLICALRFTPVQGALPSVDVLARVVDAAPPPPSPGASLTLSGIAPEFDLVYTRRGSGSLRQVQGDVEFGENSVFLYLTSRSPTIIQQEALLPPNHLDLVYDGRTLQLTAGDEVSAYYVRRSDYTLAAGISEEGLQDRILGHVQARFARGSC